MSKVDDRNTAEKYRSATS